jgi:hypothetical protein
MRQRVRVPRLREAEAIAKIFLIAMTKDAGEFDEII